MFGVTGWGWLLAAGMMAAWVAMWIWRRRVGPLFFVISFVVVAANGLLSVASVVNSPSTPSNEAGIPGAGIPHLAYLAIDNMLYGFWCWLGLLVVTAAWTLVRAAVRSSRRRRPA
jgi:hypothetical protein